MSEEEEEEYDQFDDSLNTLPVLSEDEELVETTLKQSSDSIFRGSSASSLFVPSVRKGKGPPSSTPTKSSRTRCRGRPALPSASNRAQHKCPLCRAALKTEKGLTKHIRNHKLAAKSQRKPSPSQLIERSIQDGCKITQDLEKAPLSEDLSGDVSLKFARVIRESAIPEPTPGSKQFVTVCVQPLSEYLPLSDSVLPQGCPRAASIIRPEN